MVVLFTRQTRLDNHRHTLVMRWQLLYCRQEIITASLLDAILPYCATDLFPLSTLKPLVNVLLVQVAHVLYSLTYDYLVI